MTKINPTKVVTGEVRLSYANVWEPRPGMNGGKDKYSVSLIIPKSDTKTIEKIEKLKIWKKVLKLSKIINLI